MEIRRINRDKVGRIAPLAARFRVTLKSYKGIKAQPDVTSGFEALAASYGEKTLYFNVHPNNHGMIGFLRRHGYTVLNSWRSAGPIGMNACRKRSGLESIHSTIDSHFSMAKNG